MTLVTAAVVRCTRSAHARADEETSDAPTLVLPRRGVFRYQAGGRSVVADPGTVLLFHPEVPYRIAHPTDHGDDCVALRCDRGLVADALGRASEADRAWTPGPATLRALHGVADALLDADDADRRDELGIAALAMVGDVAPTVWHDRDAARIDAVRERIAADVGANDSLAELARGVGLSPFHLARRFRARTGTSPHQYRIALRLAAARVAIREGEDRLTRVALDLGFASAAHFSAAFRRAYGCSPRDARTARRR